MKLRPAQRKVVDFSQMVSRKRSAKFQTRLDDIPDGALAGWLREPIHQARYLSPLANSPHDSKPVVYLAVGSLTILGREFTRCAEPPPDWLCGMS